VVIPRLLHQVAPSESRAPAIDRQDSRDYRLSAIVEKWSSGV